MVERRDSPSWLRDDDDDDDDDSAVTPFVPFNYCREAAEKFLYTDQK